MNTNLKSSIQFLVFSLTFLLFTGCATQNASTSSGEMSQKEGIRDESHTTGNQTAGNPAMPSLDLNAPPVSPQGSSSSSLKSQAPAASSKKVVSEEQMRATLQGYRVGVTKVKQFQRAPFAASETMRMHDIKMLMSGAKCITSVHITVYSAGREVCDLEFEGDGTNTDELLLKTITFAP